MWKPSSCWELFSALSASRVRLQRQRRCAVVWLWRGRASTDSQNSLGCVGVGLDTSAMNGGEWLRGARPVWREGVDGVALCWCVFASAYAHAWLLNLVAIDEFICINIHVNKMKISLFFLSFFSLFLSLFTYCHLIRDGASCLHCEWVPIVLIPPDALWGDVAIMRMDDVTTRNDIRM